MYSLIPNVLVFTHTLNHVQVLRLQHHLAPLSLPLVIASVHVFTHSKCLGLHTHSQSRPGTPTPTPPPPPLPPLVIASVHVFTHSKCLGFHTLSITSRYSNSPHPPGNCKCTCTYSFQMSWFSHTLSITSRYSDSDKGLDCLDFGRILSALSKAFVNCQTERDRFKNLMGKPKN